MTPLFGIIGYPLSHSFSPAYFHEKFKREKINAHYKLFELKSINEFPELLKHHKELSGINVTIPYKQSIIQYLDALDTAAAEIGAVNCIRFKEGLLKGFNTDVRGFEKSLKPLLKPHHNNALILGSGGGSLAVQFVLRKLNIGFSVVSRTQQLTYEILDDEMIEKHTLIINTTPTGMYPHVKEMPDIPYRSIGDKHLLYDLIYNPEETKFLQVGKEKGAQIKNGFEMLQLQAEESWKIWNS